MAELKRRIETGNRIGRPLPETERNAIQALRESWPGAFIGRASSSDMRRESDGAAESLAQGDRRPLDRLFDAMTCEPPDLIWSPEPADLTNQTLSFLSSYWLERCRNGALPPSREIDALELGPALGYVMLLEPVDGGSDFLYRVYGSRIVDYSRIEMTGRRVWDIPSPMVAAYFVATYRAVCRRREPLFSFHRARLEQFYAHWERLILPFVDEDGVVDRLLVGNVPSLQR